MKKGDLDNVISFDKINEDKPGEVGLATKNYRPLRTPCVIIRGIHGNGSVNVSCVIRWIVL